MNIFWLDINLRLCARYHCNAHVVKMILEYAQLLFSAHWMTDPQFGTDFNKDGTFPIGRIPYKLTHKNHPCAVWTRQCRFNYHILAQLALYLCEEYTHRYSKRHATQNLIEWLFNNCPPNLPNDRTFTIPPVCTKGGSAAPPNHNMSDVVRQYRIAYVSEKAHLLKYKNVAPPSWISSM